MRSEEVVLKDLKRLEKYNARKSDPSRIQTTQNNNHDIPSVFHRSTRPAQLNPRVEIIQDSSVEMMDAALDTLDTAEMEVPQDIRHAFRERLNAALDNVLLKKRKRDAVKGKFDYVLSFAKDPLEFAHDIFNDPYKKIFEVFQFKGWEKPMAFINPAEYALLASRGLDTLGNGALLIVLGIQYREAKSLLSEIEKEFEKNPTDDLQMKMLSLKKFLKLQREEIRSKLLVFSAGVVATTLSSLSRAKKVLEPVAPLLTKSLGFVTPFIEVMWKGIALIRAEKAKDKYALWMQGDKKDFAHAEELLLKRQERVILRRIPYTEIKERLKNKQREIEVEQHDNEGNVEYKARAYRETYRQAVNQLSAELFPARTEGEELEAEQKAETMSVMTRNALQALSQSKVKAENKFIKFGLFNAKVGLSLAALSAIIAVTLKVLTVVGVIALSSSMMAIPGLGFFVLGLGLTVIGILYFRKYRPNVFKCYLDRVHLKLGFAMIAAKVRRVELNKYAARVKRLENSSARFEQLKGLVHQLKTLDESQYDPEWHKELHKLKKNISKKIEGFENLSDKDQRKKIYKELNQKIASEEEKLEEAKIREGNSQAKNDYWEKRILKKKQDLHEAKLKDFAEQNNLVFNDMMEILIESLQAGSAQLDQMTMSFLKERIGISLDTCLDDEGNIDADKVRAMLENYFQMDENAMLSFIKKKQDQVSFK